MNQADFKVLAAPVVEAYPTLRTGKRMLIQESDGHFLTGFFLDRSIDKMAFYCYRLYVPLFIPTTYLVLSFGDRLSHPSSPRREWRIDDGQVVQDLVELVGAELKHLKTPMGPTTFRKLNSGCAAVNPHCAEAQAYSYLLEGNPLRAQLLLKRFKRVYAEVLFGSDVLNRVEQILSLMPAGPNAAYDQLLEWEQVTKRALSLL
jgi:hypothetical protein